MVIERRNELFGQFNHMDYINIGMKMDTNLRDLR